MSCRRIVFLGLSATQSRACAEFPRWVEFLGVRAVLDPYDLPVGQPNNVYRRIIADLASDDLVAGCIITNHKVEIYNNTRSYFRSVSPICDLLGAISVIRRRADQLEGDTEEVRSALRAIACICDERGSRIFSEIVIFGGGGAGRALAYALLQRRSIHGFARLTISDIDVYRTKELIEISQRWPSNEVVSIVHIAHSLTNDDLLRTASANALIINATGLGKEQAGSPISDTAKFPEHAAIWDLNYRGSLNFLVQAKSQIYSRIVSVHEGSPFFVSGWFEALTYIFDIDPTAALFADFSSITQPHL